VPIWFITEKSLCVRLGHELNITRNPGASTGTHGEAVCVYSKSQGERNLMSW